MHTHTPCRAHAYTQENLHLLAWQGRVCCCISPTRRAAALCSGEVQALESDGLPGFESQLCYSGCEISLKYTLSPIFPICKTKPKDPFAWTLRGLHMA